MGEADRAPAPFARVAVVGGGLIGGSFALGSQQVAGVQQVVVHDRDRAVLEILAARGLPVAPDLATAVDGAELVVLAVPVPAIAPICQDLTGRIDTQTLVTDVGSVKGPILRALRPLLGEGFQFIGGHPMAGSEHSGPEAADGTIFQGASWLLTPTEHAGPTAFERLSAHLRALGARVLAVDPDRHDRLVATVSHLPQILASTLMVHAVERARQEAGVLAVAAGGFRDVTRVAASEPELWHSILEENRRAVLDELAAYLDRLDGVRAAVEAGRWDDVVDLLTTARDARRSLAVKEVAGVLHDLVVPLSDTPGALARVTTALGEEGINIEDLSMRHASDGARGALVIAIAGEERVERARRVLEARGFGAHVEPR